MSQLRKGIREIPLTDTPSLSTDLKTIFPSNREALARNRVFEGGSPLPYRGEGAFAATDPNKVYRLTGQGQIDDMTQSGFLRPKTGKIKGGHQGEVH
jgi:hypothetical protein